MKFEPVPLTELLPEKQVLAQQPQTVSGEIDVKTYEVVDPDTKEVVGYIDAPLDYCELLSCPHKKGMKHPMGFINPLNSADDPRTLWVHHACMKPTQVWWQGQWRSMVYGGKQMPWE